VRGGEVLIEEEEGRWREEKEGVSHSQFITSYLPAPSLPHTLTFLSGSGSPLDVNIRSIFSRSPLAWTS